MHYKEMANSPHNVMKNRNAVTRLKHQSPTFRDVHRERCKARLRENRGKFIEQLRKLSSRADVQEVLCNTMYEEMMCLSQEDQLKDNFFEEALHTLEDMKMEALSAEEEWIMQEYDNILSDDTLYTSVMKSNVEPEVICPICQKDKMQNNFNHSLISCGSCEATLHSRTTLEVFGRNISLSVEDHSKQCLQKPLFSIVSEEDGTNLYMICPQCSYLSII